MRFRLFFFLGLLGFSGFATHNRSGYISYCYNPQTNKYDFRIYTYTNLASTSADRCDQTLYICDIQGNLMDSLVCLRINGSAACPGGGSGTWGVPIVPQNTTTGYGGVLANVYAGSLQLNPAFYTLTLIDPNRDNNINNIPNSTGVAFALIDTMYAYSGIVGLGNNCTPTITNPPIQNACAGSKWCYNPGAIDPENDSLDFSITKSFMDDINNKPQGVVPISFESIPSGFSVDKQTGTLCWNNPAPQGETNIALLIREYRKNPYDGKRYLVGVTVFDIQILVIPCPPNNITFVNPPHDTCVVAGTSFSTNITVTSTGTTPPMNLSGTGLPFTATNIGNNASHLNVTDPSNSVSGTFSWSPDCNAVQANPYQITIQASDSNTPLANANFTTFNIHIVAPPPVNLTEIQVADSILLNWSPPTGCGGTVNNPIQKYLIYRVAGCTPFTPSTCETGVPSNSGYTLIGITTSGVTTFMDNNMGSGFPPGNTYSYIVVAEFADNSFSMASSNSCITTKLDVPLMMKVSVDTTDASIGKMLVWWNKPLTNAGNFDTTVYPGPYKYILQRKVGTSISAPYVDTYTITHANYAQTGQINNLIDFTTDTGINTSDNQFTYRVAFYYTDASNNFKLVGNSFRASSIYLTAIPHNKKVILSWSSQVPWTNIKYYILQQRSGGPGDNYDIVDSTTSTKDTITNLTNGHNFCFKILAKGEYANPLIQKYLWNYSQKVCATPLDDEAPCQPQLTVAGNCSTSVNKLTWTNPNHTCNIDDVVKYYIYYTAYQDSALKIIDSLTNPADTTYTTDFSYSIAGCYVIVAVDSTGNKSPLNNQICTDNCPEYELPNIFTPNGDSLNDQYIPVKNKFIKDVDFTMFNRWGEVVFETSDPALKWDGKSKQMKQPVSDGTYYYTCTVHELHFYGIKERKLKGFVQVLH